MTEQTPLALPVGTAIIPAGDPREDRYVAVVTGGETQAGGPFLIFRYLAAEMAEVTHRRLASGCVSLAAAGRTLKFGDDETGLHHWTEEDSRGWAGGGWVRSRPEVAERCPRAGR